MKALPLPLSLSLSLNDTTYKFKDNDSFNLLFSNVYMCEIVFISDWYNSWHAYLFRMNIFTLPFYISKKKLTFWIIQLANFRSRTNDIIIKIVLMVLNIVITLLTYIVHKCAQDALYKPFDLCLINKIHHKFHAELK